MVWSIQISIVQEKRIWLSKSVHVEFENGRLLSNVRMEEIVFKLLSCLGKVFGTILWKRDSQKFGNYKEELRS